MKAGFAARMLLPARTVSAVFLTYLAPPAYNPLMKTERTNPVTTDQFNTEQLNNEQLNTEQPNTEQSDKDRSVKEGTDTAPEKKSYPWTLKRAGALAGIILLVGMYVVAFAASFFAGPASRTLLRVSFALTVIVPLLLWILLWAAGK